MPKKSNKTQEEKTAEGYFPIDEGDVKHSVEKPVKQEAVSTKEAIEKKYSSKREKETEIPKSKLNEKGYELIITEKPQAALKISSALGNPFRRDFRGVSYYELERNKRKIIVACAVGHLFSLKQNNSKEFPVFEISWAPNYLIRKGDFTKKYYDVLLNLAKNAESLTVATDYDVEGEVIGLNIVRFICGKKDASRMKFSTLTATELEKAYEEKSASINWGQAIAGETRHYLDWFYGINLSRALMNAIKTTGKFRIMSIGRVQGPTLNLIVQKERKIQKFKPKPYWQVFITIKQKKENSEPTKKGRRSSEKLELRYIKDIFEQKELKKFENLKGKKANATTSKTEQILPPNPPFNLTSLQIESYRLFGITPLNTLKTAQSLYLAGLISYPRTSSQKLPDSINYREILRKLAGKYKAEKLIVRNKPIEGKKSDPAHPSIYPTGNEQILSGNEEKIYSLIVKRFLALFCGDAKIHNKTIQAETNGLIFSTKGASISEQGWMEIYPQKLYERDIPDFHGEVEIIETKTEEKETQPPKRYSPASIISELEKRNLGTKSTRATILETLYDRNYIKEQSIEATPLGISLISTLEKYSPVIIDEELTRKFERETEAIQISKKDFESKEKKIIEEAKENIIKISQQFKENEEKIGKELVQANLEHIEKEREENKLNICPVCKKGNLAVTYSRKTRRFFVACNAYPECRTTYSLPPNSAIKKTDKICEKCGFPMLMSLKKGKRPWTFCFNPQCETNRERIETYRNKKE